MFFVDYFTHLPIRKLIIIVWGLRYRPFLAFFTRNLILGNHFTAGHSFTVLRILIKIGARSQTKFYFLACFFHSVYVDTFTEVRIWFHSRRKYPSIWSLCIFIKHREHINSIFRQFSIKLIEVVLIFHLLYGS